jgi:cytoskeletal protein RodZ
MSAKDAGELLRRTREERKLEIAEAAKATRIRTHYLQALEDGELGLLPSSAQVRGFLRTYAIYLGLEPDDVLDLLKPRVPQAAVPEQQQEAAAPADPVASAPVQQAAPSQPATGVSAAFAGIGAQLRQRRESLQLTLPEIEQTTFIPEHYLRRLESGDFNAFPSPTQARGMLGNYAEFLGLENEALLMEYAGALQTRFEANQPAKPVKPERERPKLVFRLPPWISSLVSRDVIFGGVAGLVLLLFVVWSIGRISAAVANEEPEPTAPPLTGLLLSTPHPTAGSATVVSSSGSLYLLEQHTPTPGLLGQATIEAGAFGNISLRLISLQRNWMRVTVDGQIQFEGRTLPGQSYPFNATGQIVLFTGNAAALRAFLNDQDLGILGIYGEVISIVFTQSGAATPTLSPTPSIDPGILTATADSALTPSATPSATATPSPEPTQAPDAGGG